MHTLTVRSPVPVIRRINLSAQAVSSAHIVGDICVTDDGRLIQEGSFLFQCLDAELDAFYVALSGIVRRYLEGRFDLRSPELTTEEFFVVASESPDLSQELRSLLHELLSRADLVKFAGHRPGSSEVDDSLAAAGRVLEETREPDGGQTQLGAMGAPARV